MGSKSNTNRTIKAATTGNVTAQAFTEIDGTTLGGESMIEAGGRIDLGSGVSSVGVLIVDAVGRVLHDATITQDTDVPPVPMGVLLPLYITTTSITGGTAITTYWGVRK